MIQDIFIGIDGGATKSKVRVEDSSGNLLGQGVNGPSNIRLSVDATWDAIYQAIDDALKSSQISLRDKANYRFHAGMGLAGCEVKDAYEDFVRRSHPFDTLQVVSDAHTACLGAHNGKDGSIIIIGTGIVGYQIENNQAVKVGGWGFPHDDQGSGAWLGLEAVRLTFQWIDHRSEKSPLVEDVFEYFNRDLEYFTAWSNRANSSEFAKLAPLVINHSQQEELAAVRLMKKAAHAVDKIGHTLLKLQQQKEKPLPCSLFGGIAPFLEPWLAEELKAHLVPREADANIGALLLVRDVVTKKR